MMVDVKDISVSYLTGDLRNRGLKEYLMLRVRGQYQTKVFNALRGISFSLDRGDMMGIVGTNGAGKSTLLKVISGIMLPTQGTCQTHGRIAALLELGAGFDGEMTVKENTYLRGAMMGYTKEFMNRMYPEIIAFAELESFQDRPFKHLSSGMRSRLAFSICSLVQPDILILDEVLSVGDGAFRAKSEAKMNEILASGATTLFVSHTISQVRSICNKVLWLHKGEQIAFGPSEEICDQYEASLAVK